jgi:hypothetical protein
MQGRGRMVCLAPFWDINCWDATTLEWVQLGQSTHRGYVYRYGMGRGVESTLVIECFCISS